MLSPAIHLLFVEAMQPGAAELDRRQPGDDHDLGRVVSDGFPLMAADELAEEQVVAEEEDTKIAADHRAGDLPAIGLGRWRSGHPTKPRFG